MFAGLAIVAEPLANRSRERHELTMPPKKQNSTDASKPKAVGAFASQPLPGPILAHAQHTGTTPSANSQSGRAPTPNAATATPVASGSTLSTNTKKRQMNASSDADVNFQFGFGDNALFDILDDASDIAPASKKPKTVVPTADTKPGTPKLTKSNEKTVTDGNTLPISELKVAVSKANRDSGSDKTPRVSPPASSATLATSSTSKKPSSRVSTPAASAAAIATPKNGAQNTPSGMSKGATSSSSSSSSSCSSASPSATVSCSPAVTVTNTDLQCTVCFDLPSEPILYQCRAGHLYCTDCYNNILALRNPICAVCRCVLSASHPSRNSLAERLLARMSAVCTHGCGTALTVENKHQHEREECGNRPVRCTYEALGCAWEGIAGNLEAHISGNSNPCKIPGASLSELLSLQQEKESRRLAHTNRSPPFTTPAAIAALLSTRARNIIVKDVHLQRDVFAPQIRACNPFSFDGAVIELMFSLPSEGVSEDRATSNKSLRKRQKKSQRNRHDDQEPCPLKLLMSVTSGKISEKHKLKVVILPGPDGPVSLEPLMYDVTLHPRARTSKPMVLPLTWGQVYTISQNIGMHVRVIIVDVTRGIESTAFTTRSVGAEARDEDLAIGASDSSEEENVGQRRRLPAAATAPVSAPTSAATNTATTSATAAPAVGAPGSNANQLVVASRAAQRPSTTQRSSSNGHSGTRAALIEGEDSEIELIRGSDSEHADGSHSDMSLDEDLEEDDAFDYDEDEDDAMFHMLDFSQFEGMNLDDPAAMERALAMLNAAIGDDDEDEDERAYRELQGDEGDEGDWDDEDEEEAYWERLRSQYDGDTDDASDETEQSDAQWSDE